MPAFIYKPEVPYHMRDMSSNPNPLTSAACGTLDSGEILSPVTFESIYAGSPSWCCEKCRTIYDGIVDEIAARVAQYNRKGG